MLSLIEVKPDEYSFYKGKEPGEKEYVPAGAYYKLSGGRLSPLQKNCFSPMACTSPTGQFTWLLPPERWIKVHFDGFLPPERENYGKVDTSNPESQAAIAEALKIEKATVEKAREWQRTFIADGLLSLERTGTYRRAAIAPLGAGKTLAGLMISALGKNPLVLAPKHLHGEWKSEAVKWGFKPPACSTYESAYKFMAKDIDVLIEDEILYVKNEQAKRSRETRILSERAKVVVGFTGTPTSVSPMDLRWLNCVYPGAVPANEKNWRFLWGTDTKLVEVTAGRNAYVTTKWNEDAISKFTSPYVLIVDMKEIQAELPEITYKRVYVPQPKQYEAILAGCATESSKAKAIAQARQCSDGFVENDLHVPVEFNTDKIDRIREVVETTGEPIIIFANWNHSIDKLVESFSSYSPAVVRGGADYTSEIERFKNGETKLLIANARIAEGMNLQEVARIEIFMSWCSSPVKRQQAIGRVYRPGQKRAVTIIDVVAENTLDETTLNLLEAHKDETDAFVEAALRTEFERQLRELK